MSDKTDSEEHEKKDDEEKSFEELMDEVWEENKEAYQTMGRVD